MKPIQGKIIRSTANQLTSRTNWNSDLNSGCWSLLIAGCGMFIFSLEFPVSNRCCCKTLRIFSHVLFHLKNTPGLKVSHDFSGAIEKLQWSTALETWRWQFGFDVLVQVIYGYFRNRGIFHPNHPMFDRVFHYLHHQCWRFPPIFGNTHISFLEHWK